MCRAFRTVRRAIASGRHSPRRWCASFASGRNYRILTTNDGTADAVISGTITSVYIAPLTYDSATGRVSTSLVAVTMNAKLAAISGKVLWSNPSFLYREQYQESTDPASFFEEEAPAVQRMAKKLFQGNGGHDAGGVLDAELRRVRPLCRRCEGAQDRGRVRFCRR